MRRNKPAGLKETEYLLSSPKNAERLLASLRELKEGKGELVSVESLQSLRRSLVEKPEKKQVIQRLLEQAGYAGTSAGLPRNR